MEIQAGHSNMVNVNENIGLIMVYGLEEIHITLNKWWMHLGDLKL